MLDSVRRNMDFLHDLFAGPFRGHGIIMDPIDPPADEPGGDGLGDWSISDEPIVKWRDLALRRYEAQLEYHERLGDDSVPYVVVNTNTGIFSAAFGCPVHVYDEDTNAASVPIVRTPAEADELPEPSLEMPTLRRVLEFARMMLDEVGPEVPIAVPDIQSPFDIAAMVWHKEDFFVALATEPDAAKRLVGKAERLLTRFLGKYLDEFPITGDGFLVSVGPRDWPATR